MNQGCWARSWRWSPAWANVPSMTLQAFCAMYQGKLLITRRSEVDLGDGPHRGRWVVNTDLQVASGDDLEAVLDDLAKKVKEDAAAYVARVADELYRARETLAGYDAAGKDKGST